MKHRPKESENTSRIWDNSQYIPTLAVRNGWPIHPQRLKTSGFSRPNNIKFKRFNPQTDIIKPFDCGDSDLNGFLLESNEDVPNATQHVKQLLAVTYIIEDIEAGKTVAYFSLLHDRIERDLADKTIWNRLSSQIPNAKRRRSYPAIKIGRLAVSEEYKGLGFGSKILGLVKQWYSSDNRAGCRYITVDALRSAVDFYQQNHFERLISSDDEEDTVLMYYDLKRFSE